MRGDYRRKAALARIHTTLDSFYLRQEIDWDYDIRRLLDHILEIALRELQFGEKGRRIDRGLIIVSPPDQGGEYEVQAGWNVDGGDLQFSRTVLKETLAGGEPVVYENASNDPRFINAESLKKLEVVSLMSVPIEAESKRLGAIYVERRDPNHLFGKEDVEFLGAFSDTIAPYVKTALIHQDHVAAIRELKSELERDATMPNMLGRSREMDKVLDLARIAASVDKTFLITGESGCGKELLARAIHARSPRADRPFVVVDCSGLSQSLLESELFGHVKGSFTGANSDKAGAFEEADEGTLFLDEISDAPIAMQQQLRRVLQEGEIRRVGDNVYRKVNVRVICATNRNLPQEVEAGRFLHDLYHRIHQFPVRLPPLRERKTDIPILVEHFIATAGERKNPPVGSIDPDALSALVARDWKANNVRELRNVVELAVDLTPGDRITLDVIHRTLDLRDDSDTENPTSGASKSQEVPIHFDRAGGTVVLDLESTRQILDQTPADACKEDRPYYRLHKEFSGKLIIEALRVTDWKLRPAARLLGISPVKLRQDFRLYLEHILNGTGVESAADRIDMPTDVLERKLDDLGIELGFPGAESPDPNTSPTDHPPEGSS